MTKYTEALNYLLKDRKHKIVLDDMTVVFWAMSKNEGYEGNIMDMLMGNQNEYSGTDTEEMIRDILKRGDVYKRQLYNRSKALTEFLKKFFRNKFKFFSKLLKPRE